MEEQPWLEDFIDVNKYSDEEKIKFLLLVESLNFCYWGASPKWKIEYNGELYSGYYGLIYSFKKVLLNKINILDFNELKNISVVPLAKEKYDILLQLIEETNKIPNLLDYFLQANNVEELVALIVGAFSNFRDQSLYKNKEIYFFKRQPY